MSAGQARARDGVGGGGVSPGPAGVTSSAPATLSLCQEPGITVAATEPSVAPGLQAPGCGSPVGRASASGVCLCPGRGHLADKKTVVEGIQATGLLGGWSPCLRQRWPHSRKTPVQLRSGSHGRRRTSGCSCERVSGTLLRPDGLRLRFSHKPAEGHPVTQIRKPGCEQSWGPHSGLVAGSCGRLPRTHPGPRAPPLPLSGISRPGFCRHFSLWPG